MREARSCWQLMAAARRARRSDTSQPTAASIPSRISTRACTEPAAKTAAYVINRVNGATITTATTEASGATTAHGC